ncbi:unnamed protein product [Symbiodinium necroappetens]|uniref:Uncharacterized protein n=1 Tax=Symbiodinium necroappetens TaxID=1628268 RepID=A0A812LN60_9DINO|nr:unnamed protein product [Symbiodinium necroappetens]
MVGAVPAATDAVAAVSNPVALATLPGALPFAAPVAATDAMKFSLYPSGQKVKTQMCRFFPFGTCSKGEACAFAHTETDLGKPVVEAGAEIAPTPASKVMRAGDWMCECGNHNFASRIYCNSCGKLRPGKKAGDWMCSNCRSENDASRDACQRCNSAKANANLTEKMEASSTAKGGPRIRPSPYGKGGSDSGAVGGKGGQNGWWDGQWDGQTAGQSEDPIVSALVQAVDILAGMAGGAPMVGSKQREGDWYCDCGNYNFESRVKCNKHSCGKIRPGFVEGDWLCRRRECKAKNGKMNEARSALAAAFPGRLASEAQQRQRPHEAVQVQKLEQGQTFKNAATLLSMVDVQALPDGGIRVCNLLHVDPHVPRLVPSNIVQGFIKSVPCRGAAYLDMALHLQLPLPLTPQGPLTQARQDTFEEVTINGRTCEVSRLLAGVVKDQETVQATKR